MEKQKNLFVRRLDNFFRYRGLLQLLVVRDIKLKYRRSFLGYVWSVLNPLLIMVIQALVFSLMFNRSIENFPAYLIAGNILFGFMRESASHAMGSITGNAALFKKTYVPKYIFTLSKVTSDLVNLCFSFGAMILVIIFTGIPFTWYMLLCWIPLLELYVFCIGLGLFLAQCSVFFKDITYIWNAVTTGWMYLTPLFYPIDVLPQKLQWFIVRFNPMFYYITQFRDLVVYGQMPWLPLIWRGAIMSILALGTGMFFFMKNKDRFILYI